MTDFYLTKRIGGLIPSDPITADLVSKLPFGATIKAKVSKPRNPKHHAKIWALMTKVVEAGAPFPTAESLMFYIKVRTGHCDMVQGIRGHKFPMPRSISFAAMDQTAFSAFYDAAVKVICTEVLPGLTDGELMAEINQMVAA